MLLLLDIGNTHTHVALASSAGVARRFEVHTRGWAGGDAARRIIEWGGGQRLEGGALCSVVPEAIPLARTFCQTHWGLAPLELTAATLRGLKLDYPRPETLGPDRLANALAAFRRYGPPVIAVDFGTAVTFDVVDVRGCFVGGVIAPGWSAMTDYLHEKTARLPLVRPRWRPEALGRSTVEAINSAATHGYAGLVRELLNKLSGECGGGKPTVVATGGYARWMARMLPEIKVVEPNLTLDGLRLHWELHQPSGGPALVD